MLTSKQAYESKLRKYVVMKLSHEIGRGINSSGESCVVKAIMSNFGCIRDTYVSLLYF